MIKQATEKQVREHYKKRGYVVRISEPERHVRYRNAYRNKRDTNQWLEGRYVDEYVVTDDGEIHLT